MATMKRITAQCTLTVLERMAAKVNNAMYTSDEVANHAQVVMNIQTKRSIAGARPHARATISLTIRILFPTTIPKRSIAGALLNNQVV
jgi:hypothetical protein